MGKYAKETYDLVLTTPVRRVIREFYKGICQYCMAGGADHVDHIISQARGGCDNLGNYILSCESCNRRKGAGDIAPRYLALITAIADQNKDRIYRRLRAGCYRTILIGLSPKFILFRVTISKPPTAFQVRMVEACNTVTMGIAKHLNYAKSENTA